MNELKITRCLSLLVEENETLTIIRSSFCNPQMYYILVETAYDSALKIEFVTGEDLSKILDIPLSEIESKFKTKN